MVESALLSGGGRKSPSIRTGGVQEDYERPPTFLPDQPRNACHDGKSQSARILMGRKRAGHVVAMEEDDSQPEVLCYIGPMADYLVRHGELQSLSYN